jgi:hypothetical protein
MKLITIVNASCPNLDIHKSKEIVALGYKILELASQMFPWFWQPIQEWHAKPLASNLGTQFGDFDARPCTSTLILNNINKYIAFGNKQKQVLHEFFLSQIFLLIRNNIAK